MHLSAHQLFQIVRTIVNRTPGVHSCEVPVNLLCALLASLSRMPGRLHLTNFSVTRTNKEKKRMAELSCERLIWLLNVQAILSKNINTYTFHIHVAAAVCITNENINIGTMKEMGDSENEANSFEVLSWLALPVAQFAPHPDMYGNGYINSQGYFQEVFNFSASAFDKQLQYRGQQTNFQGKDETTAEEKWAQWPHKTCTLLGPKVARGKTTPQLQPTNFLRWSQRAKLLGPKRAPGNTQVLLSKLNPNFRRQTSLMSKSVEVCCHKLRSRVGWILFY